MIEFVTKLDLTVKFSADCGYFLLIMELKNIY